MTPKQFMERLQLIQMHPRVQNSEMPDDFLTADVLIAIAGEIHTQTEQKDALCRSSEPGNPGQR